MTEQPNILLVISDHLSPDAIGAYGNPFGHTPNMDRVAAEGVAFSSAFTTCPLCQPARASFWTGRLPHETRVLSNGKHHENGPLPEDLVTVGDLFSKAGYRAVHFGKRHDFGTLRGFDCAPVGTHPSAEPPHPAWPQNHDSERDNDTADKVVDWLRNHGGEPPFLAVADLNNPHNICGWVGENSSFDGPAEPVPIPDELPALPANFRVEDMSERPVPVRHICCTHRRLAQAAHWSEEMYRHYIAAYYHYTQLADRKLGMILDTLQSTPAGDSTLVLIMADHGDGQACHGMVTKHISFYEETTRIPFILAGPGIPARPEPLDRPLISLLDLLPTLCDCADIPVPEDLRGRSVLPAARGDTEGHHPYVVSEWHTEFGYVISPGRMVRTPRYKYTYYREDEGEELYDLATDPGETRTLVRDPAYAEVLAEMRALLDRHIRETRDPIRGLEVQADPRWRNHEPGYENHQGPCPAMEEESR